MSFREAINSIFWPSKDKLHSTLEEVDKKIEDKDKNGDIRPLQKAINNIREKIKTDNKDNDISPNKRALFKSQLDTLEDMNDAYETYRKVKYTKPTNAELKKLFEWVNSQISETGNNIEDDQERIEEVMKIEKEDHKDWMINTGSKRYRDIVELHTDFEGIRDTFN
jgi:mRNA-degrading endonuclease RelE of RelBE toxin-antitoxin system